MAFNLKQLGDELKKKLQQGASNVVNNFNQPRVVNNPQPLAPKIQQYFNPTSNNGQNFWSTPVAKGLNQVQTSLEASRYNLPKFNLQPYIPQIQTKSPILNTVANLPANLIGGITEGVLNAPARAWETGSRIGYDIPNIARGNIKLTLPRVISDIAPAATAALDVSGLGAGKQLIKQGIKSAAKEGLLKTIGKGALEGAAYGGGRNFFDTLSSKEFANSGDFKPALIPTLEGLAGGAIIGGALKGSTAAFGKIVEAFKGSKPNITEEQAVQLAGKYVRDKAGRFAKQMVGYKGVMPDQVPYEPKLLTQVSPTKLVPTEYSGLYKKIDQKLGVPENFDIKRIKLGAGVKEITPEGRAKLKDANAELYDAKNSSDLYQKIRNFAQRNSSNLDNPTKIKSELVKEFGEDPTITLYRGVNKVDRPLNVESDASSEIGKFWSPNPSHSELFARRGMPQGKAGEIYSVQVKASDLLNRNDVRISEGEVHLPDRLQQNAKIVKDFSVAQQPLSVPPTKGAESMPRVMKTPELPKVGSETLPLKQPLQSQPLLSQTLQTPTLKIKQSGQALEDIIAQGRKQIGSKIDEPKVSIKQSINNLYTQWVDRFNPIIQASQKAKGTLKTKGASLRPEFDPEYLVRRLTGAGGIADNQFKTQLEPIIKQVETAGIPKLDLDTYLANKRMAGFGQVGRDIYGVDPQKAGQIVNALETKYPNIGQFADQLYNYQNKGFQEMVDAGFISPENAKIIQGQNPDYAPLKRVMDEVNDYLGVPTRKTMQGSQPIAKIKGSTRQIESPLESIIGNTFSQRAAIEKNRVAKAIVGLQNIAGDMGFTRAPKSDLNTITIWNNGQKEYWNVGKDIADVAKGVNEEQMNLVLKVLQAPAALLRQGATGRNPEFMLPNILRDQLDAGVTSKYGYIPFVDYVSGLKSMITNDSIYQKWANSGAKIDLGEMSGKKSIQGYFDTATKKKGLFSFLGGALDTMGKYSEVPTRVGLFKKAYKKTGNDLIAALESRDATVDFARMGSKMKVANSIIPFLNVGVQGFDKLIRSVKSNPAKVLFNATLYGTAPAIATTIYNLTNHPKEYAEIPQYEKDSNFVLVKGRNANGTVDYLTFPKGNVLPTITNPIQSFIDYAYGNDQQSFKEMALQTLSSTLPVIGDGQSVNEIALKTIGSNIPQLFKPAAENVLNKSFYKYDPKKEQTKDIVPSYLQNKEPYQQTYKFTPQMYQKIGALINTSPLKVQNIMEGYLAGYSKIPAQIIEMATKASNRENISPNEKTILRRFIKQTYPSSGTKPTVEKTTTPVMERLGLAAKASEMQPNMLKYTKDGKDQEVDLNKYFEYPTLDPKSALGKEAITRYKSSISNQVNKIYDAYQSGALTEQQASDYINQLSVAYDKTKKPKAPKKSKKITIKYAKYTPKKITIKRSSVRVSPTIKKPKKLKLNRKYTIKLK